MPAEGVWKGDFAQASYGVEAPDYYEMSTATVAATTLTEADFATQGMVSGRYKGQYLVFLNGTAKGKQYLITDNTTTVVTCDSANFTTDAVGVNDFFYITTYGLKPTATDRWMGIVPNLEALEEELDVREFWTAQSGRDRLTSAEGLRKVEKTIEYIVQNPALLALAMGAEATVGSTPTNSTTLNGAREAGARKVTLASGVGYALNDIMQVGSGATAECRKIMDATATPTFTLDAPLGFAHATGETVAEVVAPYTHTFTGSTRQPSFTIERVFKTLVNTVFHTGGLKINEMTMMAEATGELRASLGMIGKRTQKGLATASTVTSIATRPYFFYDAAFLFNAVTVVRIKKFSHKVTMDLRGTPYLQSIAAEGKFIFDLIEARRHHELSFTVVPINSYFWDLQAADAEYDGYITFTRSANDYLKIYFDDVRLRTSDHPIPEEGEVDVEAVGLGGVTRIEAKDSTPWWIGA